MGTPRLSHVDVGGGTPRIRLLGAIRIAGAPRALTGAKARTVLAALALRIGHVVPVDQLIDDLWGDDDSPLTARNTVQVYISAVRRAVEAVRGPLEVQRLPGGYRLTGPREQVDWHLFQALMTQSRVRRQRDEADSASALAAEALRLWEGPALADAGEAPLRRVFAPGMESARLGAIADRIDIDLTRPVGPGLVTELSEIVRQYPLDERFAAQLIEALFRSDQRGEALAAYANTRERIVSELGLEPGTRLRELHAMLLADEPPQPVSRTAAAVPMAPPAVPHWPGEFVGRAAELSELEGLLETARLVTVVGPPGVGKSRLAFEAAHRHGARQVVVVELEGVTDPERLPQLVASAVGLAATARGDITEQLRAFLLGRSVLILLDNCEHLRDACGRLAVALATGRPLLRVLATSTQPLGVDEEARLRLEPLPVPDPDTADLASLRASDAVRLFELRAREVRPSFALTPQSTTTIARICRSVDGLPLAIELASARVGVLSGPELLQRLDDQLGVLSRPSGDQHDRHGSLGAALSASYRMLRPAERRLFEQLSCFTAGFTLSAVEAVPEHVDGHSALDLLHALVDKSLVVADIRTEETSFRLLEPVRQFAAARLDAETEQQVRHRHAQYFATLCATAAAERRGPRRRHWQARLRDEQPDLDAALDWAVNHGAVPIALSMAADLWWHWVDMPRVGALWFRQVLAAAEDTNDVTPQQVVPVLLSASVVTAILSHHEGLLYAKRAFGEAESTGDVVSMMRALQQISDIAFEQGDLDEARRTGDEALRLATRIDDSYARGRCGLTVAYNYLAELRLDEATDAATESLRVFRRLDDVAGQADARMLLGEIALRQDDVDRAAPILDQVRSAYKRMGGAWKAARAGVLLAWSAEREGRSTDADSLIREACDLHLLIGQPWSIAHDLDTIAVIQSLRGRHGHAAALLAAASNVRAEAELRPLPYDVALRDPVIERCRTELGPGDYRMAARKGLTADLETAIGLARVMD
jgi:predicted ATPase/DNA-binding SARP family transcriptional activator